MKDLFVLSLKRAELVAELLIENGFPADRVSHSGAGNAQPLIKTPKNDDEEEKISACKL